MDDARSPAQLFALVFGVVLVIAGILGFFYNASFVAGAEAVSPQNRGLVLGILEVNAWHNIVHVLTGALGLAVAGTYSSARAYAYVVGIVYIVVTVLGFVDANDTIFELLPVNTEDNILHLLIGIAGVGAGLATPSAPAPTTAATA